MHTLLDFFEKAGYPSFDPPDRPADSRTSSSQEEARVGVDDVYRQGHGRGEVVRSLLT